MNALLKPSETDDTDAIAAAYRYAAKGDPSAALTQAVSDAVVAIEELRSRLFLECDHHGIRPNERFNPRGRKPLVAHPLLTIGSGKVKTARCLNQQYSGSSGDRMRSPAARRR